MSISSAQAHCISREKNKQLGAASEEFNLNITAAWFQNLSANIIFLMKLVHSSGSSAHIYSILDSQSRSMIMIE